MVTSTYAVIIEAIEKDGIIEIINDITVKDVLSNDDGSFNSTYYMLKDELNINGEESEKLLNSKYLDEALQKVLKSIAEYRIKDKPEAKLSEDELYKLLTEAILKTNEIDDDLKSRIINKASIYRKDISKYMYDLEVSLLGNEIWNYI